MVDPAIQHHLDQLGKPLQYAMQHNFAHLAKLRDLEPYMQHQIAALQAQPLADAWQPLLHELGQAVRGFDALDLAQKQTRLVQVRELLTRLQAAAAPPAEPAKPVVIDAPATTPSTPAPQRLNASPSGAADALSQPVQYVRGVGPKRAALLAKLNLHTVTDLLWCLPIRYEDRRNFTPLGMLRIGQRQTFYGVVRAAQSVPQRRGKPLFVLTLEDDSGALYGKWFQTRGAYLQERFPVGARVVGSGIITLNAYTATREVVHPDLEVLEGDDTDLVHFGRLVPIYPLTAGLHQKTMRALMKSAVDTYVPQLADTLPEHVKRTHGLPSLPDALRQVHFPDAALDLAQLDNHQTRFHQRLIFEEFFLLELGLALQQRATQREQRAAPYQCPNHLGEALMAHLPFHLTAAQHRVLLEILDDLQHPFPMNRLIQGDVGSGKTIVALLAMLMAVSNGFQAALMAPTEILAEQHVQTLRDLLQLLELEVVILTSAVKGKRRQELLERVAQGDAPLIVGTHALLYDEVQFHRLGMIVVDEQHRFGVLQRATLRRKGLTPDVLVMTATPIPRTLSMTLYGDLDLSVIDELPPDRLPVHTKVLTTGRRDQAYNTVRKEVRKGHQAYIVYPLIEESESLDLKAAVEQAAHLQQEVFPEHRLGLLHGRLATEDKDAIMQAFKRGELDILVSTTVIEVGVDVANATVMLIENAERFGLAQLHQLRGRVGRGAAQAHCLLVPGERLSKEGRQRLQVMEESTDGFYVAERDLEIRGPGELMGTKQAGLPELQVGNLLHHGIWLEQARHAAFSLIESDPTLALPEHHALRQALKMRWHGRFELASVG
jgi:ATP-dependent DNA helicase RecG